MKILTTGRMLRVSLAILGMAAQARAVTLEVPGTYPTIEIALAAAQDGDVVLVAPGDYDVGTLSFPNKKVTLASAAGPTTTILRNGGTSGTVVRFNQGQGPDSLLAGFTITGGKGSFTLNSGGLVCSSSSPTIRGNVITGNRSKTVGGGITLQGSQAVIEGNLIIDNEAESEGGGVSCVSSSPLMTNNVIVGNRAWIRGSGLYFAVASNPVLRNETIAGNTPGPTPFVSSGGGLYVNVSGGAGVTLENCIVWKNVADNGPQIHVDSGSLVVRYSDVEGGWPGLGNIASDPRFVDPGALDVHLRYDSPCRDAGQTGPWTANDGDFEGDPRVVGAAVDMGADEAHPRLYWKGDASPGGAIELDLLAPPATSPVALLFSADAQVPPLSTTYGPLLVDPTFLIVIYLPPMPADGLFALPANVPSATGPLSAHLQALAGSSLTNAITVSIQ